MQSFLSLSSLQAPTSAPVRASPDSVRNRFPPSQTPRPGVRARRRPCVFMFSEMVRGPGSPSSSDQRPCPALVSLSPASIHLKPSRPPSLSSLLKRTPYIAQTEPPPMGSLPSPSSGCAVAVETCPSRSVAFEEKSAATEDIGAADGSKVSSEAPLPPPPALPSCAVEEVKEEGLTAEADPKPAFTCGRQRLQHHRIQMAGKVIIPDTWGLEQRLQEWVSYGIVEEALRPAGLMSARTALVNECQQRAGSSKAVRTDVPVS